MESVSEIEIAANEIINDLVGDDNSISEHVYYEYSSHHIVVEIERGDSKENASMSVKNFDREMFEDRCQRAVENLD